MGLRLAWGSLLAAGLLGSFGHCSGMCGPLVLMVGARLRATGLAGRLALFGAYHTGRVAVYMLTAALLGAFGALLGVKSGIGSVNGWVSIALGGAVMALGLGYLGLLPIERWMGGGGWLSGPMQRALKGSRASDMLVLGALNGLLPCGLVYSALLTAASLGGPLESAIGMGAFGLGTWPVLILIGMGGKGLGLRLRHRMARLAGFFILFIGLQLALRGMASLGWIGHVHVEGWMLW
jgi:sulfite exporter TauE/SafE